VGVELHVLGVGKMKFYPCIAFFCGDDPSQHRVSGLQEGNPRHGCIYCNYPTLSGEIYDPSKHLPRDPVYIHGQQIIVDNLNPSVRKQTGIEKAAMKELQKYNIHPFVSPFHDAPMGENGNIYNATPPDLLHLFCAGLMKSCTAWITTIISAVHKDSSGLYRANCSVFDKRISCFPYVSEMPHLYWTRFKGGLMQFSRKNKKEKEMATGSFGSFRSTTFISALFQSYYAIGFQGDVLPNDRNFVFRNPIQDVKLGNVTGKVQRAIVSLLDCYFECKRKVWTEENLKFLERKLKLMYLHVGLLWELKQAVLISSERKLPKMKNLHKHFHFPMFIANMGSLNKCDTSTYESLHKEVTTGMWRNTSRRHGSLIYEMTNLCIRKYHQRQLTLMENMLRYGSAYAKTLRGYIAPEGVIFDRVKNIRSFRFYISESESISGVDCWNDICRHAYLPDPNAFITKVLRDLKSVLQDDYSIDLAHDICRFKDDKKPYEMMFVGGVSYEGSDDSAIGKGTLYATPIYGKQQDFVNPANKARHDTVLVNFDNDGLDSYVPARIILMIQVNLLTDQRGIENTGEAKILLLVQYMISLQPKRDDRRKKPKQDEDGQVMLGDAYVWDKVAGGPARRNKFVYQLIPIQTIVRPVFVANRFWCTANDEYNVLRPNSAEDLFYVLDRKFFDRSGWEQLTTSESNFGYSSLETTEEQRKYLISEQTEKSLLFSNTGDEEVNANHRRRGKNTKRTRSVLESEEGEESDESEGGSNECSSEEDQASLSDSNC